MSSTATSRRNIVELKEAKWPFETEHLSICTFETEHLRHLANWVYIVLGRGSYLSCINVHYCQPSLSLVPQVQLKNLLYQRACLYGNYKKGYLSKKAASIKRGDLSKLSSRSISSFFGQSIPSALNLDSFPTMGKLSQNCKSSIFLADKWKHKT